MSVLPLLTMSRLRSETLDGEDTWSRAPWVISLGVHLSNLARELGKWQPLLIILYILPGTSYKGPLLTTGDAWRRSGLWRF